MYSSWKRSFLVFLCVRLAMSATGTGVFVKTKGEVGLNAETDERQPSRGSILSCVAKCQITPTCSCLRMSTSSGNDSCQLFTTGSDGNLLDPTDFIYYTTKHEITGERKNLALKKPASQSSVYELNGISYSADRAVDGNNNTNGFSAPYISHTKDGEEADPFPWWQVDLKREYVVTEVVILNRKDWADRLHDLEIRVGNNQILSAYNGQHFDRNPLCSQLRGGDIKDAEARSFLCQPCSVRGRYVTIQIVRNCGTCRQANLNILNLSEVFIFGTSI